jgi:hypothetical protein
VYVVSGVCPKSPCIITLCCSVMVVGGREGRGGEGREGVENDVWPNNCICPVSYSCVPLLFVLRLSQHYIIVVVVVVVEAYMCTRFFSGGGVSHFRGGGGVKFVDPIFNGQVFSKKKNQINFFFPICFFCVFFKKNKKNSSISSKLCILLLLCPIMI